MAKRQPLYYNAIIYVMGREPICISGIYKTTARDWAETAIEIALNENGIKFEDCCAIDILPIMVTK